MIIGCMDERFLYLKRKGVIDMKSIKKYVVGLVLALSAVVLTACSSGEDETVKIGVVGEDNEAWDYVIDKLAEENIKAELVIFNDYQQPNAALADGEIDLNAYQHKIFLEQYNKDSGTDLTAIADTYSAPLGIYSDDVTSVDEVKEGDSVVVPNDATNGGRALLLLEAANLIKVDPEAGTLATVDDIIENPYNLTITPVDASQTARSLGDATFAVINSGMASDSGLLPTEDAIYLEPVNETFEPYTNIIVARAEDKDNETYKKIVEAYQTDDTARVILETKKGSLIPAWEGAPKSLKELDE